MKNKRTEIGAIGEFGLVDLITKDTKIHHNSTKLGTGDDAAIIDIENSFIEANSTDSTVHSKKDFSLSVTKAKYEIVVSSDIFIENTHFDLSYFPLKHVGYKVVTAGISDICAMNAKPTQILINIAISNRFSVEAVQEIYSGIHASCDDYNVDLVGGDTTSSTSGLILSITAIGIEEGRKVCKRSTAKPNNVICVTGSLGGAYLGLRALKIEKKLYMEDKNFKPQLNEFQYVIQKQIFPKARTDIIDFLNQKDIIPTAMIDISDGLASELFHISKHSNVGVCIYEDKIPIDSEIYKVADNFNLNPTVCALNGGEDYELLFTLDQDSFQKIESEIVDLNVNTSEKKMDIYPIGYIHDDAGSNVLISADGESIKLEAQGWIQNPNNEP